MGDEEGGSVLHQSLHRVRDRSLGRQVHRAGGLVEDEHGRVSQERPGQRDALALATRQPHSALAHDGLVSIGERLDEVVRVRGPRRGHELLRSCLRACVEDVLRDRGREQDRFLQHDRELTAQVAEPVVANVDPIQQDPTAPRLVEARKQPGKGRLPGARPTHDANEGAALDVERGVLDHGWVPRIAEGGAVEDDVARGASEGPGTRSLEHVGMLVQERIRALQAGDRLLKVGDLPAHALQGLVQQRQVGHDHQ